MKVIFAGRDNSFNRKYVSELFKDDDLICFLSLEIDRFTLKGRIRKIRKRIKKYGLIRVLDELSFQVFSTYVLRKGHERDLKKTQPDYFMNVTDMSCPIYQVDNIHSEKWLKFIRDAKPDIIFSICCNVIFRSKLFTIPKLGTYVLHEGITPEYKGLHTPIWSLLNKEPEFLGYSVIKVNSKIDGGEILAQDRYELNERESLKTWSWIGHNALIRGLPKIDSAFQSLKKENGFKPIDISNRNHQYYSWIRLSTFLWKTWNNRWTTS